MELYPSPFRMATSEARDRMSEIVRRVQDPRVQCVLTRHGKAVGAIVSMPELRRIMRHKDEERVYDKSWAPGSFYTTPEGQLLTMAEAGEAVRKVQLDRLAERRILVKSGLRPVPGGEVEMEVTEETLMARAAAVRRQVEEKKAKMEAEEPPAVEPEVKVKRRWWRFGG